MRAPARRFEADGAPVNTIAHLTDAETIHPDREGYNRRVLVRQGIG
jgi:hypothetical protein